MKKRIKYFGNYSFQNKCHGTRKDVRFVFPEQFIKNDLF
jgi:hypothetical protein